MATGNLKGNRAKGKGGQTRGPLDSIPLPCKSGDKLAEPNKRLKEKFGH